MIGILNKLKEGSVLLSDGAWGTMLFNMGLESTECPELWNITHPEKVFQIARSYVDAGAKIIGTNSFGGSRLRLDMYELGDKTQELNLAAINISKEAADDDTYVLGTIGPTGKILMMEDIPGEEIYMAFSEQAMLLEQGGADALIIETMSALDEADLAIKAARENTSLPVICSFSFEKTVNGDFRTMMGVSPTEMVSSAIASGANIVGANCGNGFDEMIGIVKEIRKTNPFVLLMIQANAGIPELIDGKNHFREGPEELANKLPGLLDQKVNIIGGCCGTSPDHIARFADVINHHNESIR